ncbi:hypothetical protein [Microbacterium sp. 2FI]|uniref:hypothetical protein n=1 Tax=Microbacterium sp. 2FI TaxID=2502193 RepID=UPI0010FA616F|nr:hypothetical protein [Microbacterium sp. 2FI]
MSEVAVEHEVTLWMVEEVPARLFYAGRRWRVTDVPTRLRETVWAAPRSATGGLYGWRFQATDDAGESFVFDVYRTETDWHVHRTYS